MSEQESFNLHGRDYLFEQLETAIKSAPPSSEVELVLEAKQVAVTRYAHNRIHQNVSQLDNQLWVRVLLNNTLATVECHSLEPAQIKEAIAQAATTARLSRGGQNSQASSYQFASHTDDSGFNVEPGAEDLKIPETYQTATSFYESTANQTPSQRAEAIATMVEAIRTAGFEGYGTYSNNVSELAVVNTRGLRSYANATASYLKVLAERGSGESEETDGLGSGFADQLSRDVNQLDPLAVANSAIEKCRLNLNQIELPPGSYAAVLEPDAVADMVRFVVLSGCGAETYQENRSFMSGKMGELVTGANINLWEDPYHPNAMPFGLDYDGLRSRPVPLIISGKAAGVTYDLKTAARSGGHISTGNAPDPTLNWNGPVPTHLVMQGGTRSLSELISNMQRGIVVTRLHYTHCPDPKRVVATGTTRDGTFLVENGEIVAAVKNMRFTQSVLELLAGVEEFGQAKTCRDWWAANGMGTNYYYLPSLRVNNCNFTGTTTF